jgi:hypothetical protein
MCWHDVGMFRQQISLRCILEAARKTTLSQSLKTGGGGGGCQLVRGSALGAGSAGHEGGGVALKVRLSLRRVLLAAEAGLLL